MLGVAVAGVTLLLVGPFGLNLPIRAGDVASSSDPTQYTVVRIFYNPNGFQTPCVSRLLPDGTAPACSLPNYLIHMRSLQPVLVASIRMDGAGFQYDQNFGPDLLDQRGAGIALLLADPWRSGDLVHVFITVQADELAPPVTLDLGTVRVEQTDAWPRF